MPSFCSAFGCSNSGHKLECIGKISFHSFPLKNPDLLKEWLVKMKRKHFVPSKHSKLCSLHFENNCFFTQKCGRRVLKAEAVPTIFTFPQTKSSAQRSRMSCEFGFPKDQIRRKAWIKALLRKDPKTGEIWEPSQYSVVCSSHFSEDVIDRSSLNVVRMRENAVPTIFSGLPKCLQMTPESSGEEVDNPLNDSTSGEEDEPLDDSTEASSIMVCSVVGCKSKSSSQGSVTHNVSFHQFPMEEERINLWLMAVRRADWTPNAQSAICSLHFEDDCFDKAECFTKLHPHAIPTLFPKYPSNFQDKMKFLKDEYIKKVNTRKEKDCTTTSASHSPQPAEENMSETEESLPEEENLEFAAKHYLREEIKQLQIKLEHQKSLYQNKLRKIKLLEDDLESSEYEP